MAGEVVECYVLRCTMIGACRQEKYSVGDMWSCSRIKAVLITTHLWPCGLEQYACKMVFHPSVAQTGNAVHGKLSLTSISHMT